MGWRRGPLVLSLRGKINRCRDGLCLHAPHFSACQSLAPFVRCLPPSIPHSPTCFSISSITDTSNTQDNSSTINAIRFFFLGFFFFLFVCLEGKFGSRVGFSNQFSPTKARDTFCYNFDNVCI